MRTKLSGLLVLSVLLSACGGDSSTGTPPPAPAPTTGTIVPIIDAESGKLEWVDTNSKKVRHNYKTNYNLEKNTSNKLIHSPYFKTNILDINSTIDKDYSEIDSFVIYMCVEGSVDVISEGDIFALNIGETLLIPAALSNFALKSNYAKVLEVFF